MNTIKPILYRVETYIVPEVNKEQEFSLQTAINEIDDLKIVNQLNTREDEDVLKNNIQRRKNTSTASNNKCMESKRHSIDNNQLIKKIIIKDITNKNESLPNRQFDNNNIKYNVKDFDEHLYVQNEFQSSIESQEAFYPVRQFKKFNNLVSIDEKSENFLESKVTDFCHHGFKNDCTATISSPQQISDEIFKKNWLHKMEILQQRDTALREKEMDLQKKERELFRREKELRIAERAFNDKLKLVDQQLKHQKDIHLVEKRLGEAAQILSHEVKEPDIKTEKLKDCPLERTSTPQRSTLTPEKIINPGEKNEESDKKIKYPTYSKNYPSKQFSSSNTISGTRSYALKYKEQPPGNKIRYDDLNSTLSADNGDSTFVQTSERFNPLLYKKPFAFTRSASERWTKKTGNAIVTKPLGIVNVEEKSELIEENKIFRKLSENICASQDKNTRFQNYGLVDCKLDDIQQNNTKHNPDNEKKLFSYLDLATGDKYNRQKRSKDRPISWNEEMNEWLQKKRQAYNLAIKNSAENKENVKCNIVAEKGGKSTKKDVKNKLFTIFR